MSIITEKYPEVSVIYALFISVLVTTVIVFIFSKFMKLKRRWSKINAKCKHGIKGGKVLDRCHLCREEKKQADTRRQERLKVLEIRNAIKQQAKDLYEKETKRLTEILLSNEEKLLSLSPKDFEDVIAEMYRRLGYSVKQTPFSNDKGKDAILIKDGQKFIVECNVLEGIRA